MDSILNNILKANWRIFLAITIVGIVCYGFILNTPFKTIDDYFSIIENPDIKSFANLNKIFGSSFFRGPDYYRPFVYLSFMMEYHFFKLNSFYFNLTNMIVHILTAFGVFLIVSRIMNDRRIGFWTGIMFVLHPVQWECVSNIPGRSIILCALFYVYSFLFYLKSLEGLSKRTVFYALALAFYIMGLLSKESAVVFPLVLVLYQYLFRNDHDWNSFLRGLSAAPFFIITALYFCLRKLVGISEMFWWDSFGHMLLGIMTFLKSVFVHLSLIVFPFDLYYDRSQVLFKSFLEPGLWLVLGLWLVIIFWLVRVRKQIPRELKFFFLWVPINFLVVAQIMPVKISWDRISSAEHFLYLPSVGLFVLLIFYGRCVVDFLVREKFVSSVLGRWFTVSFFIFLFLTTLEQNFYSRQQIAMFKRSLEHNPENVRVRNSLAVAYASIGQFKEAEKNFRSSLEIEPYDVKARIGLGVSLCNQGKFWEGIQQYEQVVEPGILKDILKHNLTLAYDMLIEKYNIRLKEEPGNPQLHYSLGVMYAKRERYREAKVEFKEATRLNPRYKNAFYNLAYCSEAEGKKEEAVSFYEQVVTLDERNDELDIPSLRRLGDLYKELGNSERSKYYFDQLKLKEEKKK